MAAMANLQEMFTKKSNEFDRFLKMGRTQLQDAVPMTLGQEFAAFATLIREDQKILAMVGKLILEVNLGATAIGTGVNAPRGYGPLAVKLSKICNDLRLLSSGPRAGLKEINLPELQAGSSIMPAEAGQLQLNVMEPLIAESLFESILLLQNACIALGEKCVAGIVREVALARGVVTEEQLDEVFSLENLMKPKYDVSK